MPSGTFTNNGSTDWRLVGEAGFFSVALNGTFGSGTVKLQVRAADGSTAIDVPNASWLAATVANITLSPELYWRLNLSGATSPSLNWLVT